MITYPPYLQYGDTIGITCPGGYMSHEKTEACITTLQSWGYQVMVGKTLHSNSENYFSGNDQQRLEELQAMLDDKHIKAILFARGGYGMGRIIDDISFKKFLKYPKWLIGFSDITVMHSHLLTNYNIASIHGPMAAAFNGGIETSNSILSLHAVLNGEKAVYNAEPHAFNNTGKTQGILLGGNLTLLAHLTGTASDIDTNKKILFIEDIGEYLYNVDRMLFQLKRSGKFKKLKGLIIGGFTDMKDTERKFGKSIDEILHGFTQSLNFPVCYNFPVSHGKENVALKIGGKYRLVVEKNLVELSEL